LLGRIFTCFYLIIHVPFFYYEENRGTYVQ
jgi:hypothetical protein